MTPKKHMPLGPQKPWEPTVRTYKTGTETQRLSIAWLQNRSKRTNWASDSSHTQVKQQRMKLLSLDAIRKRESYIREMFQEQEFYSLQWRCNYGTLSNSVTTRVTNGIWVSDPNKSIIQQCEVVANGLQLSEYLKSPILNKASLKSIFDSEENSGLNQNLDPWI